MTPGNFKELLDRYSRSECTKDEVQYIERWYQNIRVDSSAAPDDLQQKLWAKIQKENNLKRNFKPLYVKIAASLLFLCVVGFATYISLHDLTSRGITRSQEAESPLLPASTKRSLRNDTPVPKLVELEDGSSVTLQPNSQIYLPDHFTGTERIVSLEGEAFFQIRRDTLRPFYVYSGEVVTKVLGTSFSIKARDTDKQITVSVKTGKVSVFTNPKIKETKSSSEVILTPNQKAVYDRDDIVVTKELVAEPEVVLTKPTLFKMQYHETPVTQIFEVLEENYGVDIQCDEVLWSDCVLTTRMSDEGLFERIEVICRAINASYTVDDAVIHIHGNGCQ